MKYYNNNQKYFCAKVLQRYFWVFQQPVHYTALLEFGRNVFLDSWNWGLCAYADETSYLHLLQNQMNEKYTNVHHSGSSGAPRQRALVSSYYQRSNFCRNHLSTFIFQPTFKNLDHCSTMNLKMHILDKPSLSRDASFERKKKRIEKIGSKRST